MCMLTQCADAMPTLQLFTRIAAKHTHTHTHTHTHNTASANEIAKDGGALVMCDTRGCADRL